MVSVIILTEAFGLFEYELSRDASLAGSQTIAVNLVIFVWIFDLFNTRSLTRSLFQLGFFSNHWAVGGPIFIARIQLFLTYTPFKDRLFGSAQISVTLWLRELAVGLAAYVVIEVEKWLKRKFRR